MNKQDIQFFDRVAKAMVQCPCLALGFDRPTLTAGSISKAYHDFAEVNNLASMAISKYLFYMKAKQHLRNSSKEKELDEGFLEDIRQSLPNAHEILDNLEKYIATRDKERWA